MIAGLSSYGWLKYQLSAMSKRQTYADIDDPAGQNPMHWEYLIWLISIIFLTMSDLDPKFDRANGEDPIFLKTVFDADITAVHPGVALLSSFWVTGCDIH
jgi:hypothetical protein